MNTSFPNSISLKHFGAALTLAAGLCAALLVTPAAHAQTALGTGRGLEKDLRRGGTGNTRGRDFGAEVRLRNSVVTGNAAGGRSLRIPSPYSDVDDFRDSLGSSDIFAYRRDSLYSGLNGQGYRGTEGLQYQFAWTTGGATRGLLVNRGGEVAAQVPAGTSSGQSYSSTRYSTKSWQIAAPVTGAMRSTASFNSTRPLTPTAVGFYETEGGGQGVIAASNLLGLRGVSVENQNAWNKPLGTLETPAAGPGQLTPPGSQAPGSLQPGVTTSGQSTTPPTANPLAAQPASMGLEAPGASQQALSPARRTAYDDLRVRLNAEGEELDRESAREKAEEERQLAPGAGVEGSRRGTPGARPDPTPGATTPRPGDAGTGAGTGTGEQRPGDETGATSAWDRRMEELRERLQPPTRANRRATEREDAGEQKPLDARTMRTIRRAGQENRINGLIVGDAGATDAFVENVRQAESLMAKERYFDAEERFTRAVTIQPGDANALAGRINAQLGSGLLISAASNLEQLAQTRPDAIGMVFADRIMPSKNRQEQLVRQLRNNLSIDNRPDIRVPRQSALLLAYLGYQRTDAAMIREGLDGFAKHANPEDATLQTFLRGVWLDEVAEPAKAPAPAPAPATAPAAPPATPPGK